MTTAKITVDFDKLDFALEGREVDDTTTHECVEITLPADDNAIIGRVNGELIGPQSFERRNIAMQSRHAFPIVE